MRKRKWIAALLAMTSVMTVNPSIIFAQSENHVDKVVTVGLGSTFSQEAMPHLVIELKDGLAKGDSFYLKLDEAIWAVGTDKNEIKALVDDEAGSLETEKITDTMLEVKVTSEALNRGQYISIPLIAEVDGDEAKVEVDSNNTNISPAAYTFARGSNQKAKIVVAQPAATVKDVAIESIDIEEPYQGFFAGHGQADKNRVVTVTINKENYKWDLGQAAVKGIKGFSTLAAGKEAFKVVGENTLEITLPKAADEMAKGNFIIKGLKLIADYKEADRENAHNVIEATFQGDMIETSTSTLAKVKDYGITLNSDSKQVAYAGESALVSFSLEEAVADSMIKERALDITFNEGTSLNLNDDKKVEVTLNDEKKAYAPIYKEDQVVGFTVPSIENNLLKQSFLVKLNTSLAQTKDEVAVMASGRALGDKEMSQTVLQVKKPVDVAMEIANLKVGLKDQKGGSITISENGAGAVKAGKSLFIYLENGDYSLSALPEIEVTKGDIKLGKAKEVEGGIEIPVVAASTVPSVIEIGTFNITVSGMAAEGYYKAAVGGPALAELSEDKMTASCEMKDIDPIISENFVKVGEPHVDVKTTAVFTINKNIYSVNNEAKTMDVRPYNKYGRTMLPVKYVAYALGLDESQVEWDNDKKIVTIHGEQTVQLTLWSKEMFIDGVPATMSAPATLDQGRTFIPVAEVARALNVEVNWDNETKSATFRAY